MPDSLPLFNMVYTEFRRTLAIFCNQGPEPKPGGRPRERERNVAYHDLTADADEHLPRKLRDSERGVPGRRGQTLALKMQALDANWLAPPQHRYERYDPMGRRSKALCGNCGITAERSFRIDAPHGPVYCRPVRP